MIDRKEVLKELEGFLFKNPMSFNELHKLSGVSSQALRNLRRGGDSDQLKPMMVLLKFIREYKSGN